MSPAFSAPLPLAHLTLRILIVLNWLYGAAVFTLLVATHTAETWTLKALGVPLDDEALVMGMRTIAMLGVLAVPLNDIVLKRLLAMVGTVRAGDPFVAANANRLQTIAWALVGQQVLSLAIGAIARAVSTPGHALHLHAGFSTSGWLAVLLTFVLARVFAEGTLMREDLKGTV